ncbi:energy transducer TonB [Luteimonas vadosa]|uniref:Protein TonB n=1 Tax=Luteimonas vadosa TaxID=1165507 RepID=A0ABP9DUU9_9GAMM
MSSSNTNQTASTKVILRLALVAFVACSVAACKKDEAAGPAADAPADAATAEQQVDEASAALAALTPEQLREKARTAYAESRLYAPAGDNAMEYYLALREKVPGDAGVSSALTDLMPMVVIATEQSRDREDFAEAQRLYVLIDKANSQHPSLERLKRTIAEAQSTAAQRAEQAELSAEQEAERQKQLAEERERQQQQQQQQAAQQLAAQQAAEQRAAEQRAAEQRAAQQRAAEQTAAQPAPAQPAPARPAQPATPPPSNELRAVSTPAPEYPADAYRSRQSGEVEVEFTVNPDGSVSNARVVRSNPSRVFDRAALSAVRQWRFQPVGAPVTTRRSIAFNPGG